MKNIHVKIISREYLKPSIPTSSDEEMFKMCYLDQMLPLIPPFLSSGLVLYTNIMQTHDDHQPSLDIISGLKTSLSKTLTSFYPLAGRVKQSSITCNDQGLPFIEAHVNCPLSLVLSSPRILELAPKFLPPRGSLGLIRVNDGDDSTEELAHLAIQTSIFTCGGVAIGWYDIHKIMDGSSSSIFFKHWAALSSHHQLCYEGLVQPNFDAPVAAFPPSPTPDLLRLVNNNEPSSSNHPNIVVKTFVFMNHSITTLKAKASSEHVPNPSRYQALAGFIWEQLQLVLLLTQNTITTLDTILQITLDMRPFTNLPLPRGSIGNLIDTAIARAQTSTKLPELVERIHGAVSRKKGEIKECYHRVDAVRASWDKLMTTSSEYGGRAYKVVSWCNLGFSDLDFGFGKPKRMIPTDGIVSLFHRNLIILNDFMDSSGEVAGVEAWFFLEEKDMKLLESNSEFLAFASPL